MQVFGPQSLNKRICLNSIKECVEVLHLTEADTIRVHPHNFEKLVFEYRDTYGHAMPEPFFIVNVLVEEANTRELPRDYVLVYFDDDRPNRHKKLNPPSLADDERLIYRCGYCGGIVDEDGQEVSPDTRALHIKILTARGHASVLSRRGYCCRKDW